MLKKSLLCPAVTSEPADGTVEHGGEASKTPRSVRCWRFLGCYRSSAEHKLALRAAGLVFIIFFTESSDSKVCILMTESR